MSFDQSFFVVDILEPNNIRYFHIFEEYRERLVERGQGERLILNYTRENFDLSKQLSVFVVFSREKEEVYGFCSIFRPEHWPVGVVRFGNRIWIDRSYRKVINGERLGDPFESIKKIINIMVRVHVLAAKKHGLELAIFTREVRGHTRNPFSLLLKVDEFKKRGFSEDAYGYYQTVPNGGSQGCWQRILYVEAHPGARKLLSKIPRMTSDTYARNFLNLPEFSEVTNAPRI